MKNRNNHKIFIILFVSLFMALLSPFSSSLPDGLEWSASQFGLNDSLQGMSRPIPFIESFIFSSISATDYVKTALSAVIGVIFVFLFFFFSKLFKKIGPL